MRHPFLSGLIVLVSTSQFSLKTQVQLNVDRINWEPKLCKHHSAFLWRQPNSLLQKDTFFCQNLSNIYSNNIGNTQNRNPPKRLWAFEDVPFHVIYLHEIKLRNWSAFYSWQGRQWIGWLTQDDKSSKFSCKVKSPLKRNRRTWMEWHRGIAKKHGLSLAHWDINPTEFLTRSDTFSFSHFATSSNFPFVLRGLQYTTFNS